MTGRPSNQRWTLLAAGLALGAAALIGGAGCRGDRTDKRPRQFFPDLDDQTKLKSQAKTDFFPDQRSMREPVPGTIGFARTSQVLPTDAPENDASWRARVERERADLLRDDGLLYTGKTADGKYAQVIPMPVTNELVRRGKERFDIFCSACHGYAGDGKGMVGIQWSYDLPSFYDPKYAFGSDDPDGRGTDGFIFHTIRNGVPNAPGAQPALKMPAYREQVSERDAWAIVSYIRALQRSSDVEIERVPERYRPELDRTRAQSPSTPADMLASTEGAR